MYEAREQAVKDLHALIEQQRKHNEKLAKEIKNVNDQISTHERNSQSLETEIKKIKVNQRNNYSFLQDARQKNMRMDAALAFLMMSVGIYLVIAKNKEPVPFVIGLFDIIIAASRFKNVYQQTKDVAPSRNL